MGKKRLRLSLIRKQVFLFDQVFTQGHTHKSLQQQKHTEDTSGSPEFMFLNELEFLMNKKEVFISLLATAITI